MLSEAVPLAIFVAGDLAGLSGFPVSIYYRSNPASY
jgi:hypothetical protein